MGSRTIREHTFSEQAKRAQEKIGIALDAMYSAFVAECKDADAAWDEPMRKHPTLTEMAEAAEYTAQDVAAWRTNGEVVGLRVVRRNMRRLRGLVYVLALFWAIAFAELCWAVYDLFTAPPYAALALAIAILFLVCGALVLRVVVNKAAALRKKKCDIPAYTYLCAQYDRYLKRGLNGIALSAVLLASFLLSAVFGARANAAEFAEGVAANFVLLQLIVFLCSKNVFCFSLPYAAIYHPHSRKLLRHLIGVSAFSAGYWGIAMTLTACVGRSIAYPLNL